MALFDLTAVPSSDPHAAAFHAADPKQEALDFENIRFAAGYQRRASQNFWDAVGCGLAMRPMTEEARKVVAGPLAGRSLQ